MSVNTGNLYQFGKFRLDTEEKTLCQDDKNVSLPPKVFDILCLLAERKGKVVTKDEIMDTVWADSFVEESNLKQNIYTLRKVLGDDENKNPIIETVPRRGYRIAIPIQQIDSVETSEVIPATPSLNKPIGYKKSLLIFGAAACALLLIAIFVNYLPLIKQNPAPIENVSLQKLTFSGDISFPVISPDGKSFAYVREDGIYLQDVNNGSSFKLNIPDHKVFGNLQFSVDNDLLFFRDETSFDAGGSLYQVSRFGGNVKKIVENIWSSPGFSPDGKQMAFMRFAPSQSRWSLIIRKLANGEEKELIGRNAPLTLYRTGFPAWSSDGKKIATVEQNPLQKKSSNLIVVNVETGLTETVETPRLLQIEQVVWQPDNESLVLVGRENDRFFQLWKIAYSSGELRKITNDLNIYRTISLSADGSKLLSRQQTIFSHIWTAGADNLENRKQITFGNLSRDGVNEGLSWTRNNETIFYSSRITGNLDLWSVNTGNGNKKQLTENAGISNENPVLSPDEKHIYFSSNRTGSRHIWRIDQNGENPVQITFGEKSYEFGPAVSPDGNWLYFIRRDTNHNTIWRKSLTDEKVEQITEVGKFYPDNFLALSPDGKWLSFHNFVEKSDKITPGNRTQIVLLAVENFAQSRVFNFNSSISRIIWTPDGKTFNYIQNSPEAAKIRQHNLADNEEPKIILTLPKTHLNDFDWSPDGKNVAFSLGKNESDVMLLKNFQ